MIHLVTYSELNMTISRELCVRSSLKYGVNEVNAFGRENISEEFYSFNRATLDSERGAGYWLWKPYFIDRVMRGCKDGDVLIYCDAGVEIITDVNEIINVMDQDIFFFSNGHQHVHWCKADVMSSICPDKMPDTDKPWITLTQQVQASLIFFKVNQKTRDFVKEWLVWCQMPGFIDDSPSKLPNHPEFAEHRYDQAILCCLQIKYGYKLHWWPDKLWYESQRYKWPEDKYPSMIKHHRKRNNEYS